VNIIVWAGLIASTIAIISASFTLIVTGIDIIKDWEEKK
jgi:hypothetical protein